MVKNLSVMQEMRIQSLGQEDPLEKGMITHSSILAWRIPWTEEPDGLQSVGLQSGTRLSSPLTHLGSPHYIPSTYLSFNYWKFITFDRRQPTPSSLNTPLPLVITKLISFSMSLSLKSN